MAFTDILPENIVWRKKEGMSDGVSSQGKSWYSIIQDKINDLNYDKKDIETNCFNPPLFNEASYYRDLFNKYYKQFDE